MVMALALGIFVSYLIGSIPTGYVLGRMLKGIDIREFGSGNIGATNVFRVIGRLAGISVLVIDLLKGLVCVTLVSGIVFKLAPLSREELYKIILGMSAIAGHNWSVFLKFRGGKGVATSAGVVIGLLPRLFCIGFSVWLILFLVTGYVSLASIISSICIPLFALLAGEPPEIIAFTGILAIAITYRHRPNILRLKKGEEKRVSLFKRSRWR